MKKKHQKTLFYVVIDFGDGGEDQVLDICRSKKEAQECVKHFKSLDQTYGNISF